MNSKVRIGELIRETRIGKGFKSQQAFADALSERYQKKTGLRSVQKWERGEYLPEMENMLNICDYLDLDIDYLIGRIEQPTHAVKFIQEQTGLSEQAIQILQKNHDTRYQTILSKLIEDNRFSELLWDITMLKKAKGIDKPEAKMIGAHLLHGDDVPYIENPVDAWEYTVSKRFMRIVENIVDMIPDSFPGCISKDLGNQKE